MAAAARHDLGVHGVAPYRLTGTGPGGLIFGYASLSERAITEGIDILAPAVAELRNNPAS